jgi:hypothetical protein
MSAFPNNPHEVLHGFRRLVAGLNEKVRLPPDASWDGMNAEFREYCLRISIKRVPEVSSAVSPLSQMMAASQLHSEHFSPLS